MNGYCFQSQSSIGLKGLEGSDRHLQKACCWEHHRTEHLVVLKEGGRFGTDEILEMVGACAWEVKVLAK